MDTDLSGEKDSVSDVLRQENAPVAGIDIKEFDLILEEHKKQQPHNSSSTMTGLHELLETRMVSHRSSNPELNYALRRLHQLRVEKRRLDREILRMERLVKAFELS